MATEKGDFRGTIHLVSALKKILNYSVPIEMYRQTIERLSSGRYIRAIDLATLFPDPDGVIGLP